MAVLCLSISIDFSRIIHSGTEAGSVVVIYKKQKFTVKQLQHIVFKFRKVNYSSLVSPCDKDQRATRPDMYLVLQLLHN